MELKSNYFIKVIYPVRVRRPAWNVFKSGVGSTFSSRHLLFRAAVALACMPRGDITS